MSRILFHYSVFNRGGAEQSTLRLIKLFVKNNWEVHTVFNFKGGDLETELPEEVKVTHLSNHSLLYYSHTHFGLLKRAINKVTSHLNMKRIKQSGTYDIACIGLQGLDPFFVTKIVNSKRKLIFIRNDIRKCAKSDKIKDNLKKYQNDLEALVCVSETVKKSIESELPELSSKAVVVYNVLDAESMKKKIVDQKSPFVASDYLKVVTVCRMIDKAKGLIRMLKAYEELYKRGKRFEWYFIGDGVDLPKMKEYVKGKEYEKLIHFEGKQSNPFPYYKYADLVAVLSYYEGLCGVVNEAKVSGAAVIATEFSGIHEQIQHGVNGWIVDNSLEAIIEGLDKLISDEKLLSSIRNNTYPDYLLDDQKKFEALISI